MSDSELAVVAPQTFPAPILIERAGPSTRKKFFEFFTVPIRNANTRAAYYRAIQQFLAWADRVGYQDLEDIEPITVAAYIETLQREAAPPTVKQRTRDQAIQRDHRCGVPCLGSAQSAPRARQVLRLPRG